MDDDLERALAASGADQADILEEERQIQEAIRLSMMDQEKRTSSSGEGSTAVKRKADEEFIGENVKRPRPSTTKTGSARSSQPGIDMAFPNGALRITRTPGRRNAKNCVNLADVIHKEHLVSACIYAFFIADEELFKHLPLSHTDGIPIYIGRDANMDPVVAEVCRRNGVAMREKITKSQLQEIGPALDQFHKKAYGDKYHAFYAWSSGSSHSKILVLVYPKFLRIVITSCNMMDIDTELGDNHWYIHDLPKRASRRQVPSSGFEVDFLAHTQALGTPLEFIESVKGMYDYSTIKVHLVTSVPGTHSGAKAEQSGLLRLRHIIRDLDLKLAQKKRQGKLQFEVCAASLGNLSAKWLDGFYDCALGRKYIETPDEPDVPKELKLFYPTVGDVRAADEEAQQGASNIGCHVRPWPQAPKAIRDLFHHYHSKDPGKLFHQKLILTYDPLEPTAFPYYIYIGSANLSPSAWGALEKDKKGNEATCDMKLVRTSNFECGVVIPGDLIKSLLEPGTESWQDGVVPYVQTASKYDLSKDRPWNDPRWVKDFQES
ncbi:Tyrosyl-DNA phosphodiesterase 1 [Cytospora mali]|uniref:Tyrosyl-DNA phosphodiesterase 1 n=1 Tax=Cytospora mali TaxID=578113 RepID=A0A194VCH5_CYTMA|nr:Tyrosyl-DNA phosphodiesterase 1 [Valsa mali var. pyri (nom. inval.)]